jgi:hypothetical protein
MIPTNEKELTELFRTAIIGITPRLQFKGAEKWKPYDRSNSGALTTRRFQLVRTTGLPVMDGTGIFTTRVCETMFELRVRTDYAVPHQHRGDIVPDDFHQLMETLGDLKSSDNGLIRVLPVGVDEQGDDDSDNIVVDHIFTVFYLRAR